ncbi:hypothetical protein Tco_1026486 [Tanacetum coccineum]
MTDKYNHYINFRDDPLPITKFSYKVNNASKEATMRITRNNQPFNIKIYDKFILKMLRFSEWLELHALASKRQSTSNDQLLKNQKAKFQWVATQAEKLGVPPTPQLTAFEITPVEKKKKRKAEINRLNLRYELVKEVNSWQNCSLKRGRTVFKNGRALNAVLLLYWIDDTSQLPPLRKQPRITINIECLKL